MCIDLPSLYGEEWPTIIKSKKSGEFNKHLNPKNNNYQHENISNDDIQKIKSIAILDKNSMNENFGNIINILY
jgi:hypothetical protein